MCFNRMLFMLYMLHIVDLVKHLNSLYKIQIIYICYTSPVYFVFVHLTPHSIVNLLNLDPCNEVYVHIHAFIHLYMCSSWKIFSKVLFHDVCLKKLSCMQTLPFACCSAYFS
jgi:hypothetical protein